VQAEVGDVDELEEGVVEEGEEDDEDTYLLCVWCIPFLNSYHTAIVNKLCGILSCDKWTQLWRTEAQLFYKKCVSDSGVCFDH
jgi:hypothetical protein